MHERRRIFLPLRQLRHVFVNHNPPVHTHTPLHTHPSMFTRVRLQVVQGRALHERRRFFASLRQLRRVVTPTHTPPVHIPVSGATATQAMASRALNRATLFTAAPRATRRPQPYLTRAPPPLHIPVPVHTGATASRVNVSPARKEATPSIAAPHAAHPPKPATATGRYVTFHLLIYLCYTTTILLGKRRAISQYTTTILRLR